MLRALPGLLVGLALALGCHAPVSFEMISLERARALVESHDLTLLDVVSDGAKPPVRLPGGVRWRVSSGDLALPRSVSEGGGVLIVGSDQHVAHRSAAALARAGNHPVYVFIPRDAEERSSLYAVALQTEEIPRGEDS